MSTRAAAGAPHADEGPPAPPAPTQNETKKQQDRLPTPYGLARSGVAPDHQDVKNVTKQFEQDLRDPRCAFFGGARVRLAAAGDGGAGAGNGNGNGAGAPSAPPARPLDLTVAELRALYDAVVLAHGAESDRPMRVPGAEAAEEAATAASGGGGGGGSSSGGARPLRGVVSAREFVWWYNGHPDALSTPSLEGLADLLPRVTSVAVCGAGNVALDVARLLLRPPAALARTDASRAALAALRRSAVRDVHLFARRGPVQAACTPMELKELLLPAPAAAAAGRRARPQAPQAAAAAAAAAAPEASAAAAAAATAAAASLGLPATPPPPPIVRAAPGALDVSEADRAEMAAERPKRRLYEIMTKAVGEADERAARAEAAAERADSAAAAAASASSSGGGGKNRQEGGAIADLAELASGMRRTLHLQFYRNPVELLAGPDGASVAAVRVERTRLERPPGGGGGGGGASVAVGTGQFEEHEAQLVLKSIGYRTLPLLGVPFDARRAVVPNAAGRVLAAEGAGGVPPSSASSASAAAATPIPGLYVCGWAKRGPTGVISTNLTDAEETVASLAADRDALLARRGSEGAKAAGAGLAELLRRRAGERGAAAGAAAAAGWVDQSGWARIDAAELAAGREAGKVREKMTDVGEMLRVAANQLL